MTRNRNRSRKPKAAAPAGPRLAHELFSELNATFYEDDPSEYLLTKIEALTLMLAPAEALVPAYESERVVGVSRRVGAPVPSKEARDRYVRTECVLVLHHACEMLLRLFFAHVDKQDCPWLGMAASVSFAEFKGKVSAALQAGFDRDDVKQVFLGGTDPAKAALNAEDGEFEGTVTAWQLLLETAADTVLSESFLYNAAKHGLTVVHTDESTQMVFTPPGGGDPIPLVAGSQFAYLHKPQTPGAKGGTEWWVSLTRTLPDQDIEVSFLIQQAVSSLWNVARRRYTGQAGEVSIVAAQKVRDAVHGPVAAEGAHVRTLVHELVKKDANDNFGGIDMHMSGPGLPSEDAWNPESPDEAPAPRRVVLPVRQQDQRIVSTSSRKLLPFAPNWSSRV
ncbi:MULTISPECIES: hypothetical protein [Mycobacteriaceae]|uniref:Uncharacterized protein n=2 Tax=Mycolicibacterium TaxID=1866885 RepID=A0ABR5FMG8_9MYCO|nr:MULTISPECIES: hypothetical protein [Mycobacteriaceae]KLI09242.1 hypothetical protein AA982_03935 [Mycolicibacterium senegalense]KLO47635.1 hypothetical protein ABW05_30955 [Mycolicibacterium senegalense]OLT94344.1 hypothetical protein BKG60_18785 [Mycobacterium syngnathidarum]